RAGSVVDEGELSEGGAGLDGGDGVTALALEDLAASLEQEVELVAGVAFDDDGRALYDAPLEGDRHDLEHLLVAEVLEEAQLTEGLDAGVGLGALGSISGVD